MIKWLIKWAFRVVVLVVVLITLLLVFKNTILCMIAEHQIRAETGMDVKIGRFSSGLFSPVVTIENLKLYNTPEFGGTEFLIIPELHVEFDPQALADQKVRIKLMRLNLAELDVVKNLAGETNIVSMMKKMPKGNLAPHGIQVGRKKLQFESIDVLNVSLGRMRFIDLKHPDKNREVQINVENEVFPNVKTQDDLNGVLIMLWLRSGGASFIRPQDFVGGFLDHTANHERKRVERGSAAARTN